MDQQVVAGLRSRSRSKTPFLRSSCDRESCGDAEHIHKVRRTPKRSTPIKQLQPVAERRTPEPPIPEEAPARRTRAAAALKTSDYSSEESPDRLRLHTADALQSKLSAQYEYSRVTTSTRVAADVSLSPVLSLSPHLHSYNASQYQRSLSPAHSVCSTDSTFAEQALADVSKVTDRDSTLEHLPYKLYKMAGEYWNKYPKTDYTYSPLSRDRVELAPGQVAVPNMSRRSLSQFRLHGASTSVEELARHERAWSSAAARRRRTSYGSSEDESGLANGGGGGGYTPVRSRWLLTRWLLAVYAAVVTVVTTSVTTVSAAVSAAGDRLRGRDRGAPYRYRAVDRRASSQGGVRRAATALAAPLVWVYTVLKQITTTTTITTETTTENHVGDAGYGRAAAAGVAARGGGGGRAWPWLLLLLLLPLVGYGCYCNREALVVERGGGHEGEGYAPAVAADAGLAGRLSALEELLGAADARLRRHDATLERLEADTLGRLQQNLVQIFNVNGGVPAELSRSLDRRYATAEQLAAAREEARAAGETRATAVGADEDAIRLAVERYAASLERRRLVVLKETVRHYVREAAPRGDGCGDCGGGGVGGGGGGGGGLDEEAVRRVVRGMLDVYDADKTGLVDYALESAGGQVISTKCTELYQIKTKQYSILGLPVWWVYTSPRYALTPGAMPAECWAFQGFPGYLVVRTYTIIEVTGFSLEHMSRLLAADGKIESAPKNFSVYGLREELDPEPHLFGSYAYDATGPAIQHFPVQRPSTVQVGERLYPLAYDLLELRIESNHGNPTYTCVYRFRVHGNPLGDLRRVTDDTLRDALQEP